MESQMNFLELTTEKLNVGDISDLVANDGCGATSLFIGTTRDNFEGKKVLTLEYVAYEPMALKMMATICDNIRHKWNEVQKVAIYHRLGVVPVKEASVVIAVSSPHRKASLEAVQYAIEELKKSVPIWKKEQYETDDFAWKENKECADGKIRRMKNIKLEFETCPINIEQLPQNLIQIGADEEEIKRRISCFVEKKREEIDLNNIMDFILVDNKKADENPGNGEKTSCARTNSIVIKQVDSKGHLRVRRVKNRCGPQVKPDYTQALDKLMKNDPDSEINVKKEILSLNSNSDSYEMPTGLKERLQNVEAYLNLKVPNPQHIYERIKAIENRILYLESISPEYKHFLLDKVPFNQDVPQTCKKRIYSLEDLNAFIDDLKTGIENEDVKPADYAV